MFSHLSVDLLAFSNAYIRLATVPTLTSWIFFVRFTLIIIAFLHRKGIENIRPYNTNNFGHFAKWTWEVKKKNPFPITFVSLSADWTRWKHFPARIFRCRGMKSFWSDTQAISQISKQVLPLWDAYQSQRLNWNIFFDPLHMIKFKWPWKGWKCKIKPRQKTNFGMKESFWVYSHWMTIKSSNSPIAQFHHWRDQKRSRSPLSSQNIICLRCYQVKRWNGSFFWDDKLLTATKRWDL